MNPVVMTDRLRGYAARVDPDGNLGVAVDQTLDVSGTVETVQPDQEQSADIGGSVDDQDSTQILAAAAGRQALYLCVTGDYPVAIRFDDDATTDDFRLEPGEKFALSPVPQGVLNAIAIGGVSSLAVIEVVTA